MISIRSDLKTDKLKQLELLEGDTEFRKRWRQVKFNNKVALAKLIQDRTGIIVDPNSLFDVQVKRIHEYKRQHLNALHVIALYLRLKAQLDLEIPSRTIIFGGKAAPGYAMAKLIIKLITSIADVVNSDKTLNDRLKVVFLPDFNVKLGQQVYPAADLSEQISTAGKEASGTGNMKFALNGALTIGTLDGANVEIRELVGAENFFLFGLTAGEVFDLKSRGYAPRHYYESNTLLREVIDLMSSGALSRGERLFAPLINSLLERDEYLLFADFQSYVDRQDQVGQAFLDTDRWTRMSILNVARTGHFSSDRSIKEYCDKIWNAKPVKVEVN
jgi:starch phosphorylase